MGTYVQVSVSLSSGYSVEMVMAEGTAVLRRNRPGTKAKVGLFRSDTFIWDRTRLMSAVSYFKTFVSWRTDPVQVDLGLQGLAWDWPLDCESSISSMSCLVLG